MDANHLLEYVIRPTLKSLELHSEAAEQLILGTIWQESGGRYLVQLGGGPGTGLIQMEPATHHDIWENFLMYRDGLRRRVEQFLSGYAEESAAKSGGFPPCGELIGNISYAVAMCRIHYLRVEEPLPEAGDTFAMAEYWKQYYNTASGRGSAQQFAENYPIAS